MQFQTPPAEWHSLVNAILLFHYSASSPNATPEELLNLILFRLCEKTADVHAELEDGVVTISRAHRSGENHKWLEAIGTYTFADGFSYDEWLSEVPPETYRDAASGVLTEFAALVERLFRAQHRIGRVVLWARISSPLERSFTAIPPDSFAHFSITDWVKGSAVSEDGGKLFSIYASAPDQQGQLPFIEAAPQPVKLTRSQQVGEWIIANGITERSNSVKGHIDAFLKSRGEEKTGKLAEKTLRKAFREVYGNGNGKRENRESLPCR